MTTTKTASNGAARTAAPSLSPRSVAALTELLGNVNLPISHPQFEELAAVWAQAKRELAAIAEHYT